jgi:hypothetical protein
MFVVRAKVGPFRVGVEPMAGADGTVAVRTVMHDEGADNRMTTVGSLPQGVAIPACASPIR